MSGPTPPQYPPPPPPPPGLPPTPPPMPPGAAPPPYAGATYAQAPTQVLGRRTVAIIIDSILLAIPLFGLTLALGDTTTSDSSFSVSVHGGKAIALLGTNVLLPVLYFSILEATSGATLGKRICGIRVRRADGTPIGFGKALGRNVLRLVDSLPYLFVPYLLGWAVAMASGPRRQRLGDLACGTFVVRVQ